jgi:serine/threonine protein kinase/formylglycine-generating enzyme required for sulfatase activity
LDDVHGLAGIVQQALAAETTVDTFPADKAGRVEKIDTDEIVGDPADSKVGKIIGGKYEIRSKLGEGGMGAVFLVRHTDLRQDFALKLLHPHIAVNEAFRERFLREAKAATAFTHKHAVQIRDFGHDGDALYMTMDFSRGRSLKTVLEKDGVMSEVRAANIAHQVLLALREAHAAGLIHRDLKPENIMIEPREGKDFVRILDFGVAKLVGDAQETVDTQAATLTRTGTVVGTVQYMSPEQASGDPDIDARSDLYSLATIVYECVTGRRHLEGANIQQMMFKLATEDPPPLSTHVKGISKKLEKLVMKNLSRERGKRSGSAAAFLGELEACSDFLQSTVAIRRTGFPIAVPIAIGVVAVIVTLVVVFGIVRPFDKMSATSPPTPSGPSTEEIEKQKAAAYAKYMKLGEEAFEKGAYVEAKDFFVKAREQKPTEAVSARVKACTFKIEFAACEAARAARKEEKALTHILVAKENALTGREKMDAAKIEKELTATIAQSEALYKKAKALDGKRQYLAAMDQYGKYLAGFPYGGYAQKVKTRYAELEELTQSFQGLLVKTEPWGADVSLDKTPIGQTPVMHEAITKGTHSLLIEKDGYKSIEMKITYDGTRLTLQETLQKMVFGSIKVLALKAQVLVALDGIRRDTTPLTIEKVSPGEHTLAFTGPGDVTYTRKVVVKPDDPLKVEVDFEDLLAREKEAYQNLPKGPTLKATREIYNDFIHRFPQGKFTGQAKTILRVLDGHERAYRAVLAETDVHRKLRAAEAFLKEHQGEVYPKGWFVKEMREIRDAIEAEMEEKAYAAVFAETDFPGRLRATQDYIDAFPHGKRLQEVRNLRRDLQREETLFFRFQRAVAFGEKVKQGKAYLQEFKKGLKIEEVSRELTGLAEGAKAAFEAFLAIKAILKLIPAGRAYLRDFEGAERSAVVQERIEKAEAEARAFRATESSAEACREYLKQFPEGGFKKAVEVRLARFGWAAGAGFATFQGKLPKNLRRGNQKGEYINRWDHAVMVYVPAGFFPMGTDDFYAKDDDGPQVMVFLSGFFIDKFEVTNRQYNEFLAWRAKAKNPRKFSHPDEPQGHDPTPAFLDDPEFNQPDFPVVGIDWFSAWAYARWAGKSLPTEAQWEKTASCDLTTRVKTKYPWGDDPPSQTRCNFDGNQGGPVKVTLHLRGRSPFGAVQMAGNVAEWCLDGFQSDALKDLGEQFPMDRDRWAVNPRQEGPALGPHAVRGGHWDDSEGGLHVTRRREYEGRSNKIGFRCALWHVTRK